MYPIIRELHSIVRWIVLLVILFAIFWSWVGIRQKRVWGITEQRILAALGGVIDLQLALGLILYFVLSPATTAMYRNLLGTVQQPTFYLLGLLHPLAMIAAAVLIHQIKPQIKKVSSDGDKFKKMALFTAIGLALILIAIPWYLG